MSLKLEHEVVQELDRVKAIQDGGHRAKALSDLFTVLPDYLLGKALRFIRSIEDPKDRAVALAAMAPRLPKSLLSEVINGAKAIGDLKQRAEAIVRLAHYLTGDPKQRALDQVIVLADNLGPGIDRSMLLASASGLPPAEQEPEVPAKSLHTPKEVLFSSLGAKRSHSFKGSIRRILFQNDESELVYEALNNTKGLSNDFDRATALAALAPYLRGRTMHKAIDIASAIEDDLDRVVAMAALTSHLPVGEGQLYFAEILSDASAIVIEHHRISALVRMIPYLTPKQREQTLQVAIEALGPIRDPLYRAAALGKLAPHLPPTMFSQAVTAALDIRDDTARASALVTLALHSPPEVVDAMFTASQTLEDKSEQARILMGLLREASPLPERLSVKILHRLITLCPALPRSRVVEDIGLSAATAFKLEGQEAILEMYRAVQDAGEWYP